MGFDTLLEANVLIEHFETYKIDWNDSRVPDGFATFILDSKGNISELRLDQPNLLDVDFSEITLLVKD